MRSNKIIILAKLKSTFFLLSIIVMPLNDVLIVFSFSITLLLSLVLFFLERNNTKDSNKVLLPSILFIMSVLSLFYVEDINNGLQKIIKNLALILVPACFYFGNFNQKIISQGKKVFLYSWVLFCIVSLIFLLYNWFELSNQRHFYNFIQTSMHHNYMPQDAMYINTALVFMLFSKTKSWLKISISLLFLSVIILFGVRLGLIIFGIVFVIYFFMNFRKLFSLKNIIITSLIFCLSIFLVNSNSYTKDKFYDSLSKLGINKTSDQVSDIGEEYHNISLRTKIWSTSYQLIQEQPILGYGAGMEKEILFERNKKKKFDIPMFHSHNQFLSVTIQYGIIGLIFFFLILSVLVKNSLNHIHYFLICLIMISSMITDSYLDVQQGIFYFSFFASLIFSDNKKNQILI